MNLLDKVFVASKISLTYIKSLFIQFSKTIGLFSKVMCLFPQIICFLISMNVTGDLNLNRKLYFFQLAQLIHDGASKAVVVDNVPELQDVSGELLTKKYVRNLVSLSNNLFIIIIIIQRYQQTFPKFTKHVQRDVMQTHFHLIEIVEPVIKPVSAQNICETEV